MRNSGLVRPQAARTSRNPVARDAARIRKAPRVSIRTREAVVDLAALHEEAVAVGAVPEERGDHAGGLDRDERRAQRGQSSCLGLPSSFT